MNLKILFEDTNFLVVDKPAGVLVHGDGKSNEETISDWMLSHYPESVDVGEMMGELKRPGVVHRLDKETSGVLVLVKNQEAHQFLKQQFKDHKVRKIYNALVYGWFKEDRGVINEPIGRSPKDFRRRLAGRGARGEMREAITEYKVISKCEDVSVGKMSFLEISPKTGRTHQIRVHMKFINHPIVCDGLYATKYSCPKGFDRLALHASLIEFENLDGTIVKVESKLPDFFNVCQ